MNKADAALERLSMLSPLTEEERAKISIVNNHLKIQHGIRDAERQLVHYARSLADSHRAVGSRGLIESEKQIIEWVERLEKLEAKK